MIKWIKANEMKNSAPSHFLNCINYYIPLTSQVDSLEQQSPEQTKPDKKVKFDLPKTHRVMDGKTW